MPRILRAETNVQGVGLIHGTETQDLRHINKEKTPAQRAPGLSSTGGPINISYSAVENAIASVSKMVW